MVAIESAPASARSFAPPAVFAATARREMKKRIFQISLALYIVTISTDLFAQERYYEWRWDMHPMWWGVWGIGMMLMMLLFWALIIVGLIVGIRWLIRGNKSTSDSALGILRERYARGEINKDEFEEKKKALSS